MTRFQSPDKYLDRKFSVDNGKSKKYRENWEKVFGKKGKTKKEKEKECTRED